MDYRIKTGKTAPAPRGLIGLVTVIVIGALVLSVGVTTAFIGHTQLLLASHADHEYALRALAGSCVEEAAYRLKLNSSYTGGTVPLGAGSCLIAVSGGGSSRTVTLTATEGSYTRRVTATLETRSNSAASASGWAVTSWQEGDPL